MSAIKEHYHEEIEAGMRPDEHPILFSIEMVKANLEGRKTMTRRLTGLKTVNESPLKWEFTGLGVDKTIKVFKNFVLYTEKLLVGLYAQFRKFKKEEFCYCQCPYGKPGDLLWVRETWTGDIFSGSANAFVYKATSPNHRNCQERKLSIWKPSIHMPKEAARIWLQVEEVRVERLQNISEEDAIAEGAQKAIFWMNTQQIEIVDPAHIAYPTASYKLGFQKLWISINGIESWHENPWVWVIKYKVLSTTGKPSFDSAQDDK